MAKTSHFALSAWGTRGSNLDGVLRLLLRFSEAVDNRRVDAIAALFTPDGLFQLGPQSVSGPPAVAEFYRERLRDPARRTRHLWSNVMLSSERGRSARFGAVLTNYVFEPSVSTTEVQMRVGDVSGVCRRDARGDWLFVEHRYERTYALRLPLVDAPPPPTGETRS